MIGFLFTQLVLLGIFAVFSIPSFKITNIEPLWEKGFWGILSGAAVFFWSWDGFMRTAIMASEIKEPEKNIPFAIVGGIAFSAIVFVIVTGTVLGIIGPQGMAQNDTPILTAANRSFIGAPLLILITAWIVGLTEAAGDLLAATRVMFAMGKTEELPRWLGAVHHTFKSPHHAIIAFGCGCAVLTLFLKLRHVLLVANAFTLIWYSIVHWDALQLKKEPRLAPKFVSRLGIIGCVALFAALPGWSPLIAFLTLALLLSMRRLIKRKKSQDYCS